jgi:hypothetical protein
MYQSKLIPRYLAIWGFIGVAVLFTGVLFDMFGYGIDMIFYGLPMALNELFVGIRLIAKGFDSPTIHIVSSLTEK